MFEQTFALSDIPKIFFLGFLEIILSVDNAVVLGILTARLPERLRAKALYIGTSSAFLTRILALFLLSFLIRYKWVQILGSAYLLYLSIAFFFKKTKPQKQSSFSQFWKVILLVELFDLAFAIDSIVAGFAFVSNHDLSAATPKLWIVYLGGMLGVIGVRYAAHLFTKILHKFPRLEMSAHLMIGWIGLKLIYELLPYPPEVDVLFWVVLASLFGFGFSRKEWKNG